MQNRRSCLANAREFEIKYAGGARFPIDSEKSSISSAAVSLYVVGHAKLVKKSTILVVTFSCTDFYFTRYLIVVLQQYAAGRITPEPVQSA